MGQKPQGVTCALVQYNYMGQVLQWIHVEKESDLTRLCFCIECVGGALLQTWLKYITLWLHLLDLTMFLIIGANWSTA